jgi:hypothetical protein
VDANFVPNFATRNPATAPRFPAIGAWRRSAGFWNTVHPLIPLRLYGPLHDIFHAMFSVREDRPQLDDELARELTRRFRPGVEQLQGLVGRDLVTLWGYAEHR